jgi:hypothetical protein
VLERPLKESELEKLRRDSSFDCCGNRLSEVHAGEGGGTKDSSRGRESTT